jgi:hypothetical protein
VSEQNTEDGGDLYRLSFDFYCQPDQAEGIVEVLVDICSDACAALGTKLEGVQGGIVARDFVDDAIADLVRQWAGGNEGSDRGHDDDFDYPPHLIAPDEAIRYRSNPDDEPPWYGDEVER